MIIKQIFSKKNNSLCEVVLDKAFNKNICEKSFIRGSSSTLDTALILDNNSHLSNLSLLKKTKDSRFKTKGSGSKRRNSKFKIKKRISVKFSSGRSLCTSTFFYKNNKNDALRFKSHILNFGHCENFLDSSYNSFRSVGVLNEKKISTLLILKSVKGGFKCYSSGRVGFLPRSHSGVFVRSLIFNMLKKREPTKQKHTVVEKRLQNIRYFFRLQNSKRHFSLIRLKFVSGKIRHRLQRKRKGFSLTRRKKLLRKRKKLFRKLSVVFLNIEKEIRMQSSASYIKKYGPRKK